MAEMSSNATDDLPAREEDSLSIREIFSPLSSTTPPPLPTTITLTSPTSAPLSPHPNKAPEKHSTASKKLTHRQRHALHLAADADASSSLAPYTSSSPSPFSSTSIPRMMSSGSSSGISRKTSRLKPYLLLASLGNPVPHNNTPHSASHILLSALLASLALPPLAPARTATAPSWLGRASGGNRVSNAIPTPEKPWTGFASGSLMNVSGKGVAEAWRGWRSSAIATSPSPELSSPPPRLVVIHDELEAGWGKVKLKTGGSARGHNGLKSIMHALPGQEFVRIGVGIGRPLSREPEDVARYVLRQMTRDEVEMVKGCVGEVVRLLDTL